MRLKQKVNTEYGQFRWVVLLLVVAVILPTVCLLWFMNEAIDNEHLVVRQKLITFYQGQLAEAMQNVEKDWAERCRQFGSDEPKPPYQEFVTAAGGNGCDGLLIYANSGERLYPLLSTDRAGEASAVFADAWQLEFVDQDYARAAQRYEQHARAALTDPGRLIRIARRGLSLGKSEQTDEFALDRRYLAAVIGQSRSLGKMDRIGEAITVCRQATNSPLTETGDAEILSLIANARLLMLNWVRHRGQYANLFETTFTELAAMLYRANEAGASLTTDQNLFVAQKLLEIARDKPVLQAQMRRVHRVPLEDLIAAETRSLELTERFPSTTAFENWNPDRLTPLTAGDEASYGLVHRSQGRTYLALLSDRTIHAGLADFAKAFRDEYIDYRIVDEAGQLVIGQSKPIGEPFATGPVGTYFPNWQIELFFQEGDVLDKAAGEQIAAYTWTGTLVIMLILAFGAVAAKSIGRQVRLNRLKNDFIATVTHELKTPLASMRVLVDTLLEGHYRDQQQVTEYLQLISSENGRLSRLIDNFLTFSRMERNKQAFQMRMVPPQEIAGTAAEAVMTKFSSTACDLETDITADLPEVKADPDAMVTVLVNLLDNACKYSQDDKQIKLSVTHQDHSVRFSVSDKGVGIPRRAQKRIFKRFYQVDRRLSRRAEGCGLGLSIAKFIVDAHAGTISVDSKPGQGCTFTVALPAQNKNG